MVSFSNFSNGLEPQVVEIWINLAGFLMEVIWGLRIHEHEVFIRCKLGKILISCSFHVLWKNIVLTLVHGFGVCFHDLVNIICRVTIAHRIHTVQWSFDSKTLKRMFKSVSIPMTGWTMTRLQSLKEEKWSSLTRPRSKTPVECVELCIWEFPKALWVVFCELSSFFIWQELMKRESKFQALAKEGGAMWFAKQPCKRRQTTSENSEVFRFWQCFAWALLGHNEALFRLCWLRDCNEKNLRQICWCFGEGYSTICGGLMGLTHRCLDRF